MSFNKNIDTLGRKVYDYSYLGRFIHYVQNMNNPDAVFIWIPKNAGTSIFNILKKNGCLKAKRLTRVKYTFSQKGLVTFGHMKYSKLVDEKYIAPDFHENSFKFCFSRNPYDRAISLYEYLKTSVDNKPNFLEFLEHLETNGIEELGLYNGEGLSHCNPQVKWIEDIEVNFYGRFENLKSDIKNLANILNIDNKGVRLPHKNRSKRRKFKDYYGTREQKIVEKFYEEDFDFFEYPKKLPVD